MDFTREPVIETVMTPKEGYRLALKNSKALDEEEFFVEALEIVSFGSAVFYRSKDRPKAFLLPVVDYQVIEVREARISLKNATLEKTIKIGGGRAPKEPKEGEAKVEISLKEDKAEVAQEEVPLPSPALAEPKPEKNGDKKRDRRRNLKRRRNREGGDASEGETSAAVEVPSLEEEGVQIQPPTMEVGASVTPALILSSLLQPPPNLISDSISHYREKFKNAFFVSEEDLQPHAQAEALLKEEDAIADIWEKNTQTEDQASAEDRQESSILGSDASREELLDG